MTDGADSHRRQAGLRAARLEALTRRLLALGDIDMSVVQAARLDERGLAEQLVRAAPESDGTVVEQSRAQARTAAGVDELLTRT
ncbi:hypothetical protein [Streptomyces sp. NPDC004286]|uniref:hypothetical protein n=1 Tax=Streptomyces sp. NPDC004286 TaxID=3364696 RepID=UPI0036A4F049